MSSSSEPVSGLSDCCGLPYRHSRDIPSLEALNQFANQLASQIGPGDVIALNGPLGAGKTTFVQAMAKALGLQETIASPTFGLIHEYQSGPYPVVHVDLYRLGPEKAMSLSSDLLAIIEEGQSLLLIEWACYGPFLDPWLTVAIEMNYSENIDLEIDSPESISPESINKTSDRRLSLWSQAISLG